MNDIKIIFFSGAGLSAESGIPTFRADNGLWEQYNINTVCNFKTWEQNRDTVHHFYNTMRGKLVHYEPNQAHKIIANIQKRYGKNQVLVITQNVDDLLERAGCEEVMHVHGEITKMRCLSCSHVWDIGYQPYLGTDCPACGKSTIKPDVIFFYEKAPLYANLIHYLNHSDPFTTIVVIGTSGSVVPIDYMLENVNAKLLLNNIEPSIEIDERKYQNVFYESAATALQKIETILTERYG